MQGTWGQALLAWPVPVQTPTSCLAFGFIPGFHQQNTRMARKASTKPDSGFPRLALSGIKADFGPEHAAPSAATSARSFTTTCSKDYNPSSPLRDSESARSNAALP